MSYMASKIQAMCRKLHHLAKNGGCSSQSLAGTRNLRSRSKCSAAAGDSQHLQQGPPLPATATPHSTRQQHVQQKQQMQQPAVPPPPSPYEFMLEVKRFTCTECGKCCQGSGEVWANEAECAAIAKHLGLSLQHFISRYTKAYSKKPGWRMLRVQPGSGDCVFLDGGGTKCTIYGVRPLQCSSYPWWPELMDPAAWVAEGRAVCEGIEHEAALPVDAQEKAAVLRAATEYFAEQAAAAEAGRRSKGKR